MRARGDGPLLIGHRVALRGEAPPRLGRLVIAGLGGAGARKVRVRWRRGVRTVRPRRFGAYLVVLPRSARQRDVAITVRRAGGARSTTDFRRSSPRRRPVRGSDRVELRLDDDAVVGGRLGLLTWRTAGGQRCSFLGDLVSGRVGALRERAFFEYPINDGGSCGRPDLRTPVSVSLTWTAGRVSVTGFARADVAALELRTPQATVPLTITARRAFAHVFPSDAGERGAGAVLVVTLADGSREELPLGGPPPTA